MPSRDDERAPLLRQDGPDETGWRVEDISFAEGDAENPKSWSKARKMSNVAVIALMAILSPLASSMFTPGINTIADDLGTTSNWVIGATTGFVIGLGVGPLVFAPLSETFGRRRLYLVCFSIFSLLQIPTALSVNVQMLIAMRSLAGLFGSVGIANGGGTINDMFEPHERASVFGWYLLGPLLGPTIGPLLGGLIVEHLNWRWIFWILTILCAVNTLAGFAFLQESYAPVILQWRSDRLNRENAEGGVEYRVKGSDDRPIWEKVRQAMRRPLTILFTQPIVFTMALYQAVIFGTMYSLYTNFENIYQEWYTFDTVQVGCLYLGPGIGFLLAVWFIVPKIDAVYNRLTERNGGKAMPEYRLPLANIGSVLLPLSLFAFAWTVQRKAHWVWTIVPTVFFGIGQVAVFNTVQNYYIDAFQKYAASAIAAGAVFRSLFGGLVPLVAPPLLKALGYGWGLSLFAFASAALSPSPLLFYYYGPRIRERYAVDLK